MTQFDWMFVPYMFYHSAQLEADLWCLVSLGLELKERLRLNKMFSDAWF